MAVELKDLYAEIKPQYDIKLHTKDCFQKMISWAHMVEEIDFVPLLHGEEFIFNSGLNYSSDTWLMNFIRALNQVHAGGLVISLKDGRKISRQVIDYCNRIKFPLFSASWDTPYIDIMRIFSVILLKNEQRETNLIAALKNAIYYPDNEVSYMVPFERNGYFRDMSYTVAILSCYAYETEEGNERLQRLEKMLHYILKNGIIYEENGRLTILVIGYRFAKVREEFQRLCQSDVNVYVGIGTLVNHVQDIHKSYENACTAYHLTKTAIPENMLAYEELGIYKLLADRKEEEIYNGFVQNTLGRLIEYDRKNKSDYMEILKAYFENECSILNTSKAMYCHKNTLSYKMNKIREILGYDILTNENRTKIMISLYIIKMGTGLTAIWDGVF